MPEAICNHLIEAKLSFRLFILHDYIQTIFIGVIFIIEVVVAAYFTVMTKSIQMKKKETKNNRH